MSAKKEFMRRGTKRVTAVLAEEELDCRQGDGPVVRVFVAERAESELNGLIRAFA